MSEPNTKPATVRVRILVVADPDGKWEVMGSHSLSDADARDQLDDLTGDLGGPPWRYTWVEADVPLPVEIAEAVVEGEVRDA